MTFSDVEIAVYLFVLQNPGCNSQGILLGVGFTSERVTAATAALVDIGLLDASQGRYRALRGAEPATQHLQDIERERRRRLAPRKSLKSPVLHSRASDFLMSRAEWRVLVINYELMFPGEGWRIIEEHIQRRAKYGGEVVVSMADYDELRKRAEGLV